MATSRSARKEFSFYPHEDVCQNAWDRKVLVMGIPQHCFQICADFPSKCEPWKQKQSLQMTEEMDDRGKQHGMGEIITLGLLSASLWRNRRGQEEKVLIKPNHESTRVCGSMYVVLMGRSSLAAEDNSGREERMEEGRDGLESWLQASLNFWAQINLPRS